MRMPSFARPECIGPAALAYAVAPRSSDILTSRGEGLMSTAESIDDGTTQYISLLSVWFEKPGSVGDKLIVGELRCR